MDKGYIAVTARALWLPRPRALLPELGALKVALPSFVPVSLEDNGGVGRRKPAVSGCEGALTPPAWP